jgi:hypothetical protein
MWWPVRRERAAVCVYVCVCVCVLKFRLEKSSDVGELERKQEYESPGNKEGTLRQTTQAPDLALAEHLAFEQCK